jgi:hypothetical protein
VEASTLISFVVPTAETKYVGLWRDSVSVGLREIGCEAQFCCCVATCRDPIAAVARFEDQQIIARLAG